MKQKKQAVVSKIEKINTELLSLTYGAIVAQLIKDSENLIDANEQLDKMGFNIGQKLIDEFLARSEVKECRNPQDVAENIAKLAIPMFLGIVSEYEMLPKQDQTQIFVIHMFDNPLNDFVELPEHLQGINYSGIIAGAIRGALAAVHWIAKCTFVRDQLKGDDKTSIQVEMVREKQDKEN